uniref:Nuclease HARBI1 n=1 Tax=Diabrotica virgifera virgifera TaxID=50390 RepID=A0A6P7H3K8_DIAVI
MLPVNAVNILVAEDEERLEDIRAENLERRVMREGSDPFAIQNTRFIQLFRLNKDMAQYVLNKILLVLNQDNNPVAITSILKFFGALSFYASGSQQCVIGQSFNLSMSQPSLSRAIQDVTIAIINTLSDEWVRFPRSAEEKDQIKARFMEARHFPGVIGAVDCTHLEIVCPIEDEHIYFNRKGYHSKNYL